jgi:2-oxoglutarate dehydrogenase E2 component (dihydrolipoamide succinyltransferase)
MRIEVKVPQLPESVSEATLLNWHKKAGEAVARDENLIDVETDKVVLELPAPGDGVLVELVKPDGSTVTSNEVIAVIDTEAAGAAAASAAPKATEPKPAAQPPRAGTRCERHRAARRPQDDGRAERGPGFRRRHRTRADASPRADVIAASVKPAPAPAAPAAPAARAPVVQIPTAQGSRPEQRVPMSRAARARRRASRAVAVDRGDPHHVQRSEHAAGHRPAQQVQGPLREGARRQARAS